MAIQQATEPSANSLEFIHQGQRWEGGTWRALICLVFIVVSSYFSYEALTYIVAKWFIYIFNQEIYEYPSGDFPWQDTTLPHAILAYGYGLWYSIHIAIITLVAAKLFLGCSTKSLIIKCEKIYDQLDFRGFFTSFNWYIVIWATSIGFWYFLEPASFSSFAYILDIRAFLAFLPFTVLLLPLQVLSEEIVFRGYLMQFFGRLSKNKIIILCLPAAVFALMHFDNPNPEFNDVWAKAYYFVFGLYWGILSIKTNGIEHSVGIHLANNVIALVIFSSDFEQNITPTIFYQDSSDNITALVQLIAVSTIHYFCLFKLPELHNHGTAWRSR